MSEKPIERCGGSGQIIEPVPHGDNARRCSGCPDCRPIVVPGAVWDAYCEVSGHAFKPALAAAIQQLREEVEGDEAVKAAAKLFCGGSELAYFEIAESREEIAAALSHVLGGQDG